MQIPDISSLVKNQYLLMFFAGLAFAIYAYERISKGVEKRNAKKRTQDDLKAEGPKYFPNPGHGTAEKMNGITSKIAEHETKIAVQRSDHENLCKNFDSFMKRNDDHHASIFDKLDDISQRLPPR